MKAIAEDVEKKLRCVQRVNIDQALLAFRPNVYQSINQTPPKISVCW
jgi:hypothetical protein